MAFAAMLWVVLPAARADALTDVRAKLQQLRSEAPIKGILDVRSEHLDQDKNDDKVPPAHIRMHIEADGGLSTHMDPTVLKTLDEEEQANAADPNKPTPTADLLRTAGPVAIGHMVSAAQRLLQELQGATEPTVQPGQLDGQPVQELRVQQPLNASRKDAADIKDYQGGLTVSLDPQGVPLAYEQIFHGKFCKFFICVTIDEKHSARLKVVNGRLVAVSASEELQQAGMGQAGHTRQTFSLQLDAP